MEIPMIAGAANPVEYVDPVEDLNDIEDRARSIIDRLSRLATEQVNAKSYIERRWLDSTRAYYGFYDPDTEAELLEAKQSRAFVKLTGAKTRAMKARLFDLLFPTDDRNWSIEPTPVPKLAKEIAEAEVLAESAAIKANRELENGNNPAAAEAIAFGDQQANRAASAKDTVDAMNKAADLMQEEMDDQLTESGYPQQCRLLIGDGAKIGTGILKGPIVNQDVRGRWLNLDGSGFQLTTGNDPRPKHKRVDPWSFFPDMSARSIDEAEFTFERYLWSQKQLRAMVKTHGFNKNAVRRLLSERKGGLHGVPAGLQYVVQLRSISRDEGAPIKGRYVGWEYHGPLECEEVVTLLHAAGETEAALEYGARNDPLDEMNVVAYFCEGELLKIAPEYPLDSGETLYSVFNVVESEASIFGYGVPDMIDSTQAAANAAWRMGLDNSAYSVKPQAVVDKTQFEPADGDWNMAPGKTWLRTKAGTPGETMTKPVEFFNIPNNMEEIATILRLCMDFIDIESGIPMPQQGEQGAHTTNTVGGMAILQNAANVVFRAIVKNFDDQIITPTMRRLYDWNMQFNPRDEIKGDMNIDARGTSVLLVKEVQATNLMLVVTNLRADPELKMMIKPYEAVEKLFQAMMIKPSDIMVTPEEYQKALQAQAEAEQPPDPAVIQAESRIESARIGAKSREMSDQTSLEIEQIRRETALVELASKHELTLEDLRTKLGMKQLDVQSGERKMAAEIGAERENAAEARARGEDPTGSGGFVSFGSEPRKSA